jgi:amino acid transporter
MPPFEKKSFFLRLLEFSSSSSGSAFSRLVAGIMAALVRITAAPVIMLAAVIAAIGLGIAIGALAVVALFKRRP